jgi:hypothetical protein
MYRGERDVVLILGVAFKEMYVLLSVITVNCKGDYTKQYDKFLNMMQILTKICKERNCDWRVDSSGTGHGPTALS